MSYRVYFEAGVLRVDFFDTMTSRDLREMTEEILKIEAANQLIPPRIADLSTASGGDVGFSDVMALADRRKGARFSNNFKSAIVAPQPVHMGLARMFQILNDHPQIIIRIFPTLAEAQAWIAEPPPVTHTAPSGRGS